jgi:tetratricopeptide (TPR) repeat protein
MKYFLKQLTLILCLLFLSSACIAQDDFQKASALRHEKKWEESFSIFRRLLLADSTNIEYLTNTSYLFCKVGNLKQGEAERQSYFKRAEYLSLKAIALQKTSAQAHYTYALALGRINENAPSKQKIANAKLIRTECEEALKYDPKLAAVYHILGRWHRTIAGFNFIEKAAINTLYGGVPGGGSYEAAIENFSKAIQLEPNEIIHKYELAETYAERDNKGDDVLANVWFKKVIEMQPTDEDDRLFIAKAKAKIK